MLQILTVRVFIFDNYKMDKITSIVNNIRTGSSDPAAILYLWLIVFLVASYGFYQAIKERINDLVYQRPQENSRMQEMAPLNEPV